MNSKIEKALHCVHADLMQLSDEEFREELRLCENGDLAALLLYSGSLDLSDSEFEGTQKVLESYPSIFALQDLLGYYSETSFVDQPYTIFEGISSERFTIPVECKAPVALLYTYTSYELVKVFSTEFYTYSSRTGQKYFIDDEDLKWAA